MKIIGLDHMVLTVGDMERSCDFYRKVLGLEIAIFEGGRRALTFGSQKINLHQAGEEIKPNAPAAQPGTGDLCFVTETPIDEVVETLNTFLVEIVLGPTAQNGARGPMRSVYFRDPDGNLVEVANYAEG
jgi:catechol 2,3-dioxygenase-like lactoylglutathione lyase family enzyme